MSQEPIYNLLILAILWKHRQSILPFVLISISQLKLWLGIHSCSRKMQYVTSKMQVVCNIDYYSSKCLLKFNSIRSKEASIKKRKKRNIVKETCQKVNMFWRKIFRRSKYEMLFKIGVLKNFGNFKGKHLYWSLFFWFQHRCFPVKFIKFLRTCINRTLPVAASEV